MSIVNKILSFLLKKSNRTHPLSLSQWQEGYATPVDWRSKQYMELYGEAEYSSVWVFASVKAIAQTVASVPFVFYKDAPSGRERLPQEHPLVRLFWGVNPMMTRYDFWEASMVYLELTGNCFWALEKGSPDGLPGELWPLRPDRMRIVPNKEDLVDGYLFSVGEKSVGYGRDEIIHLKYFNPLSEWWGMSPLAAARQGLLADFYAVMYNQKFFRQGARVERVLYSKTKTAYLYENTHWNFAAPREYGNIVGRTFIPTPGRIDSLDQMLFFPSKGRVVFDLFENVEETLTFYWYTPEGELAGHNTTTTEVVYTDDHITFRELKSMEKDDISPSGALLRMITSEEVVSYTQLSRDSYSMRRIRRTLGRDGRYHTDVNTQIVQAGAVQGSPIKLSRMEVYAETGAASTGNPSDMTAVMNTSSRGLSINTPSWESLENILQFLKKRYGKDAVLRTYEVLGELNVHVGLQIDMKSVSNLDGSERIPAPALDPDFKPIVVGYDIEKDVISGRATTTLIVKGRLQ